MDAGTAGGIAGGVIGCMGGLIGTYFGVASTTGPRERAVAVKFAAACWLWITVVLALVLLLPRPWGQLFIPLGPSLTLAIPWCNRRLAAAQAEDRASAQPPPA